MIKYISIIKDSDKGLFRYMKKYSNNFSLLSRAITPKPGIKDQFYRSQKDKKKAYRSWNGMRKRERERENQPGRRSFHRGIGTMGKKTES